MIEGLLGAIVVLLIVIAALLFKIARRQPESGQQILSDAQPTPEVTALPEEAERLMAARQAAKRARAEKPQS